MILLTGCVSIKKVAFQRDLKKTIKDSEVFSQYFTGFALYDLDNEEFISEINSDLYFTPASNTKILTLAAYLDAGNKRIPSFLIGKDGNRTILRPLGDPSFLHPDFPGQPAFRRLMQILSDTVFLDLSNKTIERYGPGWAWDDYYYYYQTERNTLPIYGNVVRAARINNKYTVIPSFFKNYVKYESQRNYREASYNVFNFSGTDLKSDSSFVDIPFITSDELTERLLSDTLNKVIISQQFPSSVQKWDTVFNGLSIPIVATMMQRSDNFLAEQLLINGQLSKGFYSPEDYFFHLNQSIFKDLSKPLIWVDGSGLSRYNMVSPGSMVKILEDIYYKLTWQEITQIFPSGGVSGTIRNWYTADTPYVFAKTGTLRHNHCLSGYLMTDSGKILVFSFMNNHFPYESAVVKREMQKVLFAVKENY